MEVSEFWSWVAKGAEDECWEWQRSRDPKGYGYVYLPRMEGAPSHGMMRAHQAAYFLSNGVRVAEGNHIGHKCDNPPCCNPKHLIEMTPKENVQDRVEKKRPGNRTTRKLTAEQVAWFLQQLKDNPKRSVRSMAKELGVSHTVLFQIKNEGFYAEVAR